jgi:hypothetical protein
MTRNVDTIVPLAAEMARLLELIDAEWRSDPTSMACFDLHLVEELREVLTEYRARPTTHPAWL